MYDARMQCIPVPGNIVIALCRDQQLSDNFHRKVTETKLQRMSKPSAKQSKLSTTQVLASSDRYDGDEF